MDATPDQQSEGTEDNLPCPWCGQAQDLSDLDTAVDMNITCDGCEQVYTITGMSYELTCPQCQCTRLADALEMAENAVQACVGCHRAFRAREAPLVVRVSAERAEGVAP